MKLRTLFTAIAAMACVGSAVPACADTSVLYEYPSDTDDPINFRMTVEVNDAGDARIHLTGRGSYLLIKGDTVYTVTQGIDGPYAESFADLDAALKARGEVAGISFQMFDEIGGSALVEDGPVTIGAWKGQGYSVEGYSLGSAESSDLVISPDPILAPIGQAIRKSFGSRYGIARTISLTELPITIAFYGTEVAEVFAKGTPTKLGYLELATISKDPIAAERFALPERVLSRTEIERYLKPFEGAPAFTSDE